ncbi:inorganic phosphate transporter [Halorubrum ezzemoulense]|jgi:PiT family inorganic phosphate transporter|uniref:Phosphate transporter n=4 Tax=Halorubrum ezzemoulense TaxID=337243 RepID=A0A256KPU8_HALEZ|nr:MULTISPECIES: inorganic phosphate transporter [Halorubrum]MDB2223931.1 inorganic phosphate transporter [Halorubrum ezzemoulense]MDB2236285.1 inorganic phosphate transporter [Halorubrum ezzemoulense]MDB2241357.1 inorganic phosphate transporter [Halorubrum ezzemoulense]MDB2248427.1 inorganic phosphate transporter [Halorubrum ezzemoulense]MDB2259416.1 inorganic phosphate transporter [Halorubrum ezzemoulense]
MVVATAATLLVAAAASLFMAWSIGAGSSGSTPFAPAVGANAISVMRAGLVVGVLGLLGAILQGANVTEAVGTELIGGVTLTAVAAIVALVTAAALVAVGVFAGYPIATAFTVTGAVVGVGLALGGDPAWPKYAEIATLWVLTPFVGGGVAYGVARMLIGESLPERPLTAALAGVVGAILANVGFALLGPAGQQASVASVLGAGLGGSGAGPAAVSVAIAALVSVAVYADLGRDREGAQRRFLLAMGGLVAFSAGGSQVGLAIGPLVPIFSEVGVPLWALLVGGGVGLLAGSWTGAPRMIKALAQDYASMGPRRSISALIPSFAIAQTAVAFGIPVSFNEIIVSAIVGAGYAAGDAGVSRKKMGYTVLAWIGSLVGAFVLGFGLYSAVDFVA